MVQYLFLVFSNNKTQKTTRPKRESFLQMGLQGRGYSDLGYHGSPGERILRFGLYLSWHLKWVFHIGILLDAIGILLKTHFGFGSPDGSLVGDSQVDAISSNKIWLTDRKVAGRKNIVAVQSWVPFSVLWNCMGMFGEVLSIDYYKHCLK
jgi:hypothetical protein